MTIIRLIRKICIILLVVQVLSLPNASAQASRDPTQAIASALRDQEFAKALELLRPALQDSPKDAQLWAMQGVAYEGQNKKKEALNSFRNALQIAPDYLPALRGAAQIEYEADSAAAIPLIRHMLQLRPGDRTGHGMLAVLEYERGNCEAAVADFERARPLFDSRPAALHAYGVCLVRLRRLDLAEDVFKHTIALEPNDSQERRLLASIQLMDHKPQDALATLDPLLQANRPDAATLDLASAAYEGAKDTQRAVNALKQAILLEPRNVNLYLDFAHICYDHNAYPVGVSVLSDGIKLEPRAAPLFLARGVLFVELGQYSNAETDFEEAYRLDPLQSLSRAGQALVGAQSSNFQAALAKVEEGLKRNPNDALLLYLQAYFLMRQGATPDSPQFHTAMQAARKAVRLQPTLADARNVLADIYMAAGRYRESIEQCRKALEINPKNQAALYHLIQALRKTGDKKELPELLKRFAQLREKSTHDENERYRYKLVEDDRQP